MQANTPEQQSLSEREIERARQICEALRTLSEELQAMLVRCQPRTPVKDE